MARDFSGGFVAHPNGDSLDYSAGTGWTVSAWVLLDTVTALAAVATFAYDGSALPVVLAIGNGGSEGPANTWYAGFYHSNSTWRTGSDTAVAVTGRWQHLVGTVNSSSSSALYRNGFLRGRDTAGGGSIQAIAAGSDFRIGANWGMTATLDGKLQDVAIWGTALTDGEILRLAQGESPLTVRPGELGSYWPMQGTIPADRDFGRNQLHMEVAGATGPVNGNEIQPVLPAVSLPQALPQLSFIGGMISTPIEAV